MALVRIKIYDGWQQDGQTFGYNTQKQVVGATYGLAGAVIGAKYVAPWGFALGGIPGAIIGGFVGAIIGGIVGEIGGEECFDYLENNY